MKRLRFWIACRFYLIGAWLDPRMDAKLMKRTLLTANRIGVDEKPPPPPPTMKILKGDGKDESGLD